MTAPAPRWRIRLSPDAQQDFAAILARTRDTFGLRQAEIYATTLRAALSALEEGPEIAGSSSRADIQTGLRSLHVARHGRRGRHVVMYRFGSGVIEVARILHDAMDLARHVRKELGGDDAE